MQVGVILNRILMGLLGNRVIVKSIFITKKIKISNYINMYLRKLYQTALSSSSSVVVLYKSMDGVV